MIDGVVVEALRRIPDERGMIMHIMKKTDPVFSNFGEVYCSCIYPGVIKGWHVHDSMTLNYVVIRGMIKLVLYDDREGSSSKGAIMELFIGEQNFQRVTIPPKIWNGFKGIGSEMAMVINVTDIPHDPSEIHRCSPYENDIPYDWTRKDG